MKTVRQVRFHRRQTFDSAAFATAIREWTELAQLDEIDLGEQLGLLSDVEAAGRRAVVRAGDQD